MATFSISGRMSVKTVRKNFKDAFGGSLRIKKDGKTADDGASMASLRSEGCKGGELELKGNTTVAGLKKKVAELYGITVEVYDADDKKPVDDGLTLASVAAPQASAPVEKPTEKKEPKVKPAKEPKAAPAPQPAAVGFSFNELLEAALSDGELTDKERSILLKKATAQGYDPDEVDLMIDGKLAKLKQSQAKVQPQPQTKQEPPTHAPLPEDKNTLLEKAQRYRKIGEDKEAITIYKRIIMEFDADCAPAYKGLFELYEKKGDYKEALKYGTRYADLNWNNASEIRPIRDLILKMFDEFVASNRKKDAGRFLDNYGKYLDRYGKLCINALGDDFKNADKQHSKLVEEKLLLSLSQLKCSAGENDRYNREKERLDSEMKKIENTYRIEYNKREMYRSRMEYRLRKKLE